MVWNGVGVSVSAQTPNWRCKIDWCHYFLTERSVSTQTTLVLSPVVGQRKFSRPGITIRMIIQHHWYLAAKPQGTFLLCCLTWVEAELSQWTSLIEPCSKHITFLKKNLWFAPGFSLQFIKFLIWTIKTTCFIFWWAVPSDYSGVHIIYFFHTRVNRLMLAVFPICSMSFDDPWVGLLRSWVSFRVSDMIHGLTNLKHTR